MAVAQLDLTKPSDSSHASGSIFTWLPTLLACGYFAWTGISLFRSTATFIAMFNSIGVDLPLSTKIIIGSYRLLYPLLFGGMAALVIAKQFVVREKWISLSITLMAVVIVSIMSDQIVRALYLPLNNLIEKING